MFDTKFTLSETSTSKLWCSMCRKNIDKGESVVFELDDETGRMENAYCRECSKGEIDSYVDLDDTHPFSEEALQP